MTDDANHPHIAALEHLIHVIDRLRGPGGCPWDREQSERSMAPHLLEEAFEAVEALEAGDAKDASEELGDVLMNVMMIARIASESARFDLTRVATGIADKLIRRHPHVFGPEAGSNAEAVQTEHVLANWEKIKLEEQAETPGAARSRGVLSGLPKALPALHKAFRIGEKAARVGFDWPDAHGPRAKIEEELGELDAAIASGDATAIESEIGDLLFAITNLARRVGVQPEMALSGTIARFRRRFEHVETALGARLGEASLGEMEALWADAKAGESPAG